MTGIAQIADGNIRELMKELYRRSGKKLYRFGVRMLGNRGLAEERVRRDLTSCPPGRRPKRGSARSA